MTSYTVQLSEEELAYYSRQIVLDELGLKGQETLKRAKVCVVGLGGLGSPVSIQLASMGVGHLRIVDRDVVEMSNLQRQHLYGVDVVGYPKVEAAEIRLKRLNPFIEVEPVPMSITPENTEKIIAGSDLVVDCLDSMSPRYALNRACVKLGIPLLFGAVITHVGNATTIIPGETPCLECFMGNVDDSSMPSCAVVGVHPSIIGIVASIQVSEAIRVLTGKPPNLAGKLIFCDLEGLTFETIKLAKVENCPICGSKPRSPPPPIHHDSMQEICGREAKRVYVYAPDAEEAIDLDVKAELLISQGYTIQTKTRLGATFTKGNVRGSILKSGVTILEGVKDMDEAVRLRDILMET
jgi:adenylyltransferase/sulfurtransferase